MMATVSGVVGLYHVSEYVEQNRAVHGSRTCWLDCPRASGAKAYLLSMSHRSHKKRRTQDANAQSQAMAPLMLAQAMAQLPQCMARLPQQSPVLQLSQPSQSMMQQQSPVLQFSQPSQSMVPQ